MQTYFWHDYETFGADPQRDLPCQFAGVRTDLDLNIIDDPVTFYCAPSEDYLPSPKACLVTGITPQIALKEGMREFEFAARVNEIFSVPGTCVAGYNSIRFDDEVTRNLLYRNFWDPYEREWRNGNSRWDLIDIVRLVYALKPDTLKWPLDENGQVSFRLERLTKENGIEHGAAHDAMSDVYATLDLAKLIKQREPKLFDWAFSFRGKQKVNDVFDLDNLKPLFHISSKYRAAMGCCAIVAPLFRHPTNPNGVVVWDLRQDPAIWQSYSAEQMRSALYTSSADLSAGQERPALKTVHVNKCPILLPGSSLKRLSEERKLAWGLDEELIRRHLHALRSNRDVFLAWQEIFAESGDNSDALDPELMIYSGGFFGASDRQQMQRIRAAKSYELAEQDFTFSDARLEEMLFRYKARNFPDLLEADEQARWGQHCYDRVVRGESGWLGIETFAEQLNQLAQENGVTSRDIEILESLKYYAESIVPYV